METIFVVKEDILEHRMADILRKISSGDLVFVATVAERERLQEAASARSRSIRIVQQPYGTMRVRITRGGYKGETGTLLLMYRNAGYIQLDETLPTWFDIGSFEEIFPHPPTQ